MPDPKTIFILLVEVNDAFYILSDDDGTVCGYDTEKAALDMVEGGYNSSHRRGYEASMSACVNWLFFKPKVVSTTGTDDLLARFFLTPQCTAVRLGSVAGSMTGLLCDRDVKAIWDAGVAPRLISEETFPSIDTDPAGAPGRL